MTTHIGERDELERRLVRALEQAPEVRIPEDFAARVASKVPAGAWVERGALRVGPSMGTGMAWTCAVVLLAAMFALAPVAGAGARHWLELGLELEFVALTAWLTVRPLGIRVWGSGVRDQG